MKKLSVFDRVTLCALLSAVLYCSANAAEFIPVGTLSLGGGTSSFEGDESSKGLDLSATYVPALKFSDKTSLLPGIYLTYYGAKSVQELIGGGTLYQDELSANLNLRLIKKIRPDFKLKYKVGYKLDYLRETKDEDWGDGLFDYNKWTAGAEAEWKNIKKIDTMQLAFDYYTVSFPNYSTLAESAFGKEVSTDAAVSPGKSVLDFSAAEIFHRSDILLEQNLLLSYTVAFNLKNFPEQKIIKSDGSFGADKRSDLKLDLSALYSRYLPDQKFSWGIKSSFASNSSSQNHYDAERYQYISSYYDYSEFKIGPVISKKINSVDLDANLLLGSKTYSGRLTQDAQGNYLSSKVGNTLTLISLAGHYPVSKEIKAHLLYNWYKQSSNMKYEQVYRYNFTTSNIMLNFSCDF